MNKVRNYHSMTGFLDLLFLTLLGFVFLFMMAFMLITPEKKQADIKTKAEYVITLTWDKDSLDDIDLWLQDPIGNTLYFQAQDVGFMHLDRDDLGFSNDSIALPDGRIKSIKINQEIASIRGFITGEWVLNIHMYNKRDFTNLSYKHNKIKPTNVEVKIEKLNPYKLINYKTYIMKKHWEEITVVRFTMSAGGEIMSMSDLPKKLIKDSPVAGNSSLPSGEEY